MTQQKQIEIIQKQYPNAGETEIRDRLNSANKYFIRESRIIQDTISFTVIEGQTDYPFDQLTTPNGGELLEVLNVEDDEKQADNFVWFPEDRSRIVIGLYQGNSTITPARSGNIVFVTGVFSDSEYGSDLSKSPSYDDEFHLAPVWKVLGDLALENGDMNKWSAYKKEYKDLEIAAKRAAGSKGMKGNYKSFEGLDPYIG